MNAVEDRGDEAAELRKGYSATSNCRILASCWIFYHLKSILLPHSLNISYSKFALLWATVFYLLGSSLVWSFLSIILHTSSSLSFWSACFSFHHPATVLLPSFLHVLHFFTFLSFSWHQFFSLDAVYTSLLNPSSLTGHDMDARSLSITCYFQCGSWGFPSSLHPFFLNRISSSVFSFTQLANHKHEHHPWLFLYPLSYGLRLLMVTQIDHCPYGTAFVQTTLLPLVNYWITCSFIVSYSWV